MLNLERRIRALERIREKCERRAIMHILFAGCEKHFGCFVVRAGRRNHIVERAQGEAWDAFQARTDELATGALRLLVFAPITPEGKPILSDNSETL
jgi:type II secretory pathway component PulJ